MLNFTLFEEDARQAAICISDSQIKFGGLAKFKQNYFCSPGAGVRFRNWKSEENTEEVRVTDI